jgi:hypothetical protein
MAEHDPSYKLLFSHREVVADLLRGFVREDCVEGLDFDTLEPVRETGVTHGLLLTRRFGPLTSWVPASTISSRQFRPGTRAKDQGASLSITGRRNADSGSSLFVPDVL